MRNFSLHIPTRIHFGKNKIHHLATEIPSGAKVLLLYGKGSIKHNGVYTQVMAELAAFQWVEQGGIEPNPRYESLMQIVSSVRSQGIDFILAVGGGSVIDSAKFIAFALKDKQERPWELVTRKRPIETAIPVGVVLTIPGTGSESNGSTVVTKDRSKIGVTAPALRPQFAILDPETTYSLPQAQTCNGIVDAFVHILEQYVTYETGAAVQDEIAEGLLRVLIAEAPKVLQNPGSYESRSNIMWTACLALNGLLSAGVPTDWSTHRLGHELTGLYGIDHARSLAIVLPAVWKVKRLKKASKLARYARHVWRLDSNNELELVNLAIAKTEAFFQSLGMPNHLVNADIKLILHQLSNNGMVRLGEHRDIDLDTSRQILELATRQKL